MADPSRSRGRTVYSNRGWGLMQLNQSIGSPAVCNVHLAPPRPPGAPGARAGAGRARDYTALLYTFIIFEPKKTKVKTYISALRESRPKREGKCAHTHMSHTYTTNARHAAFCGYRSRCNYRVVTQSTVVCAGSIPERRHSTLPCEVRSVDGSRAPAEPLPAARELRPT